MANVYYAPEKTPRNDCPSLFLAGSIDMGLAEDWQSKLCAELSSLDLDIYNPRRKDFDPTWDQSIEDPLFREQVEWELSHIDSANIVVFYFDPNGKSPVTLLELGLASRVKQKIAVCSPKGFWRRGNVEVFCKRYKIPLFDDIDSLVSWTKSAVIGWGDW